MMDIHVIVMAGASDFGRCPLATRLPRALWPVDGKTAVEHLLECLADQGVPRVTICTRLCLKTPSSARERAVFRLARTPKQATLDVSSMSALGGDAVQTDNKPLEPGSSFQTQPGPASRSLAESIATDNRIQVSFFTEELPVGTAGCIRDATKGRPESLLLVLPANILCPPAIHTLIQAHRDNDAQLTAMLNPDRANGDLAARISGVYVLNPEVLQLISAVGYVDIKEGLIPQMIRAGKHVHTATLPHTAGNFRNWQEYLCATADYLEWKSVQAEGTASSQRQGTQTATVAAGAQVDPTARLCGSVSVLEGARIERSAVVLGPAVIGKDAVIGEDSTVVGSVIWDHSRIGRRSHVDRCVLDYGATVSGNVTIVGRAVPARARTLLRDAHSRITQIAAGIAEVAGTCRSGLLRAVSERLHNTDRCLASLSATYAAGAAVIAAFFYCCWPNLSELWRTWMGSDEYSSGLLVPFLAVYVLWMKRDEVLTFTRNPSLLWGLAAILAAQAIRLYGLVYMYRSAEHLSTVLTVVAVVAMLFGWHFSRRISAVLAFLLLMLPWPNKVQTAIAVPLQTLATKSAVFMLEMLGYEVSPEGNVINIGQTSVAVAEACNGLRMITAFFVIGGLVVLIVKRAWWEKLIVMVSCLPIAILCNTIRLTLTSIAFTILEGEYWEETFHDFGGYAMMPLALAGIVGELWLLKRLTTAPQQRETLVIERHG